MLRPWRSRVSTGARVGDAISVRPSQRPVPTGSIAYSAGSTMVTRMTAATTSAIAVVLARVANEGGAGVCSGVDEVIVLP